MANRQSIPSPPAEFDASNPSTTQRNPRGSRKQYLCTYENCHKSFTRSDHLARHSLNHGTGKITCPRCSVTFNRPDLLDRHLARHRQKDEEAGGYGLGVVETRKRMWRDADGNIVSKRPTFSTNSAVRSHQNQPNLSNQRRESGNGTPEMHVPLNSDPLPTPRSMDTYASRDDQQQASSSYPAPESHWNMNQVSNAAGSMPEMGDFLNNSSWGCQQPMTNLTNNPFDDMFNPDTASSFNMPFTTQNNYNWLFDEIGPDLNSRMSFHPDQTQNRAYQPTSTSSFHTRISSGTFTGHRSSTPTMQDTVNRSGVYLAPQNDRFVDEVHTNLVTSAASRLDHSSSISVMGTSSTGSSYESSRADDSSLGNFPAGYSPTNYSQSSTSEHGHQAHLYDTTSAAHRIELTAAKNSTQSCLHNPLTEVLILDGSTRNRMLDVVIHAGSKTPEGIPVTRDHPLLSLPSLQNFYGLFFDRFNQTYPLLHRPTFEPSKADPLLVLAIVLLGATYSDKASHGLAVCIHDVLRAQIFQNAAFQAQPDLWILQTILLVECFGKSRAGQTQHDMAHLFHGLLINLIRRSDCQTVCHPKYQELSQDLDTKWRLFVDVEQRKRLAFLCFLWDTQHAVLFSQSLCMSAFELRSSLPCNPAAWEANSAEEWQKIYSKESEVWFLAVLKLYVNPSSNLSPPKLNDLSRLLILHGLMSLSWDMKRREQTALGFVGSSSEERQIRLAESYDAWKAGFDTHCMSMSLSLKNDSAFKKDFTRFSTATIAIYHAAHIILNVEIIDLQIYAGAKHILGRPVTAGDYDRSCRIVEQWVRPSDSQAAAKAAWHAAHLLRDGIMNLDNWDANEVFHYPWCLYLAALTVWAFHTAGNDKLNHGPGGHDSSDVAQHEDLNAQAEMSALVSGMTSVTPDGLWRSIGNYETNGLNSTIAKHLGTVRWAVVHEGMKILRGLVVEGRRNESENVA